MGRVETRMYRRKKRRSKLLRRTVLILLLLLGGLLLWRKAPSSLGIERLGGPTASPLNSAYDQTVESREVTLAEENWYAIQTGVFSTEEAARQKADAYKDRGAPGTVIREGEKWRVFIACYGTEGEAAAVRTRLEQNQKVETYLYAWKCPELRLRLTGKVGQLDAVEAGFTLLMSAAAALRDTSTELDAAQLTTEEVRTVAKQLDDQFKLWEDTIRSRFGRNLPDLVQDQLSLAAGWKARLAALGEASNATEMSAALKAQAMGLYDEIAAWRREFAAQ